MKTTDPPPDQSYEGIFFFNESATALPITRQTCKYIAQYITEGEECKFRWVEVVFVEEEQIVAVNQEHLGRSYVTDIISFRYDQDAANQSIEGTLYCCAPRIVEQAENYGESTEREFQRVVIHGMLHLAGYEDQSEASKKEMHSREDFYLKQLQN